MEPNNCKKRNLKIQRLKTVDSTNTYLKALAEQGGEEGLIVIADEQTLGRGRRGKSFFSPSETGLYMSILIRPEFSVEDSLFITSMTAVAVAKAIENVSKRKCGIKWVNDIYVDQKKVSGILCEGSFDYKANKTNYVIVGIGVNISTPEGGFPDDIKCIATGLDSGDIKEALISNISEEFFRLYDALPSHKYMEEYRERSIVIGERICVIGERSFECTAIDIDEKCQLLVKDDSGNLNTLSSGEISIKFAR